MTESQAKPLRLVTAFVLLLLFSTTASQRPLCGTLQSRGQAHYTDGATSLRLWSLNDRCNGVWNQDFARNSSRAVSYPTSTWKSFQNLEDTQCATKCHQIPSCSGWYNSVNVNNGSNSCVVQVSQRTSDFPFVQCKQTDSPYEHDDDSFGSFDELSLTAGFPTIFAQRSHHCVTITPNPLEMNASSIMQSPTLSTIKPVYPPLNFVTLTDHLETIEGPHKYTLVIFYAEWCPFSVAMIPALLLLTVDFPDMNVLWLDAGDMTSVNLKNGVHGFPSVVLFLRNSLIGRLSGPRSYPDLVDFVTRRTDGYLVSRGLTCPLWNDQLPPEEQRRLIVAKTKQAIATAVVKQQHNRVLTLVAGLESILATQHLSFEGRGNDNDHDWYLWLSILYVVTFLVYRKVKLS